jgi:hypothetical protein
MKSVTETTIEFDVNKVLFIIESNESLKKSFSDSYDLTTVKSMVSSNSLTDNVLSVEYANLSSDNLSTNKSTKKPKKYRKWMGKAAVEELIAENGGVKTELHSALLAHNDMKNTWLRANRFLIKAQTDGIDVDSKKLREIIALSKTFKKQMDSAIKK